MMSLLEYINNVKSKGLTLFLEEKIDKESVISNLNRNYITKPDNFNENSIELIKDEYDYEVIKELKFDKFLGNINEILDKTENKDIKLLIYYGNPANAKKTIKMICGVLIYRNKDNKVQIISCDLRDHVKNTKQIISEIIKQFIDKCDKENISEIYFNNSIKTKNDYILNEEILEKDLEFVKIEDNAWKFIVTESKYSQLDSYIKRETEKLPEDLVRTNNPMIYAFTTPQIKDAIKIGFTDQGVEKRISQWRKKYKDIELIGYWTSDEFTDSDKQHVFFKDHPVHKSVIERGYDNLNKEVFAAAAKELGLETLHVSSEFFSKINRLTNDEKDNLSKEIIEGIINAMKEDIRKGNSTFDLYSYLDKDKRADKIMSSPATYSPTPLQKEAVEKAKKAIKEHSGNETLDLLMAAVMRFGKTFTAYEIVKETKQKYVVVVSAKADTRAAWRNDINHKDFIDDFVFIEFDGNYDLLISEKNKEDGKIHTVKYTNKIDGKDTIEIKRNSGKTVIIYATLQDLSGRPEKLTDGDEIIEAKIQKDKHKYIFENRPDMMIIDETHYGSHAGTYGEATGLNGDLSKEEKKELREAEKEDKEINNKVRNLNPKIRLQCSGTPYYILASGEFSKEMKNKTIISDVSYTDMIKARDEWNDENVGEKDPSESPYYGIPDIHKFGMKLTKNCQRAVAEAGLDSKMTELFRIQDGSFVHERAILELFSALFRADKSRTKIGFLDTDEIRKGNIFKHTIVVLPRIAACHALKRLLEKHDVIGDKNREIIVVVEGDKLEGTRSKCAENSDTLNKELRKINNENRRSLILTVNRFLTGVSMPLVDSMIFMKDTQSPQEYDQAIFRLCTRNVHTAENQKGEKTKINRKQNVYLIDFKIDRMFNMIIDSAIAQAAAKGKTKPKDIEEIIDDMGEVMPTYVDTVGDSIYDENGEKVVGGMHKVKPKDLLKKYADYNKNRSITQSVADSIVNFSEFLSDKDNLSLLKGIDSTNIGGSGVVDDEGEDEIKDLTASDKEREEKEKTSKGGEKTSNKDLDELKKKFINFINIILYCNICSDEQSEDIEDLIDTLDKKVIKEFGITEKTIKNVVSKLSNKEITRLNFLLMYTKELMKDKSVNGFRNAVNNLGRINKNEVITPDSLVKKMIEKLDKSDFENAKSILVVNDKYGEFTFGLEKKFGKDILKKVKIVPSSEIGKLLTSKALKHAGLDNYIKNIIDIPDTNGNGKYDIEDFLNMKNEDILKENGGKKFDIVLMNPPYDKNIHLKFLEKVIKLGNNVISIQPVGWLEDTYADEKRSNFNKYKDSIISHIEDIDYMDKQDASINFGISSHQAIGIYICGKTGGFEIDNFRHGKKVKKIIDFCKKHESLEEHIESNKVDGIRVKTQAIKNAAPSVGTILTKRYKEDFREKFGLMYKRYSCVFKDGYGLDESHKWWSLYGNKNKYTKKEGEPIPCSIEFDTIEEAKNFEKYCKTDFFIYCNYLSKVGVNTDFTHLPWMGNVKWEGKSGKINGYKNEITDKMLFEYCKLTDEEIEQLKDTIENYE